MEAKTLLRLIKDDITHLEEITGEFILEAMPSCDEVELALVRAKALLRELELLHKYADQRESSDKSNEQAKEPKIEVPEHASSEHTSFELFYREPKGKEKVADLMHDEEHIPLIEDVRDADIADINQNDLEELSESPIIQDQTSPVEEHFAPLVEPVESPIILSDDESPVENEVDELFNTWHDPAESIDIEPVNPIVNEEVVEEQFSAVDVFTESAVPEPEKVIVNEEVVDEHFAVMDDASESEVVESENSMVNDEVADEHSSTLSEFAELSDGINNEPIESSNDEPDGYEVQVDVEKESLEVLIVSDIQEHKEAIFAEETREVKKTLNETLSEPHQLVNDILSPEKGESSFQITPINSIWDGIGINDRFLFIRELFANSSAKFETTVAALDKLATIQDAVNYLKMNFKWNKTEASHKFLDLVKRRFTK